MWGGVALGAWSRYSRRYRKGCDGWDREWFSSGGNLQTDKQPEDYLNLISITQRSYTVVKVIGRGYSLHFVRPTRISLF